MEMIGKYFIWSKLFSEGKKKKKPKTMQHKLMVEKKHY